MRQERWLVLRCQSCSQCSGHRTVGGRCPHCGHPYSLQTEVVAEVPNAAMLHREVALANTPERLREELRQRMEHEHQPPENESTVSPDRLLKAIREACDAAGTIELPCLERALIQSGLRLSAQHVMEQAESESMVVRTGHQRWMLLE